MNTMLSMSIIPTIAPLLYFYQGSLTYKDCLDMPINCLFQFIDAGNKIANQIKDQCRIT